MWTTTKDLVKENLAELAQMKEKLAEFDQLKSQLAQINGNVETLRKEVAESQKSINTLLLSMQKDTTKCLDLLGSDDMVRRVENLKNPKNKWDWQCKKFSAMLRYLMTQTVYFLQIFF